PIALILAAGLAAVAWWLDWLHTDEWRLPAPRPGLVSLCRRRFTAAFVWAGGVLTPAGAGLGGGAGTGPAAAAPPRGGAAGGGGGGAGHRLGAAGRGGVGVPAGSRRDPAAQAGDRGGPGGGRRAGRLGGGRVRGHRGAAAGVRGGRDRVLRAVSRR